MCVVVIDGDLVENSVREKNALAQVRDTTDERYSTSLHPVIVRSSKTPPLSETSQFLRLISICLPSNFLYSSTVIFIPLHKLYQFSALTSGPKVFNCLVVTGKEVDK